VQNQRFNGTKFSTEELRQEADKLVENEYQQMVQYGLIKDPDAIGSNQAVMNPVPSPPAVAAPKSRLTRQPDGTLKYQ
jgi:hypothetical protein